MKNFQHLVVIILLASPIASSANEPSPDSSFAVLNQHLLDGNTGTTQMVGPNGFNQEVTYVDQGRYGLFEGDIMVPLGVPESQRSLGDDHQTPDSIVINGFRWPDNVVPYYVGGTSGQVRADVRAAVADIAAVSDIRFVELSSISNAPYFVRVVQSSGSCTSYVGYRADVFGSTGYQELALDDGCGVATATHEFLHALGMFHEQSRSDRDNFVGIVTSNIKPSLLSNFRKITSGATNIGKYDYFSIMHYPFWAFNINNDFETVTIFSKTGTPVPFFNFQLSSGDIGSINRRYPAIPEPEPEKKTTIASLISILLDD